MAGVARFFQDALIEGEPRKLAVQESFRRIESDAQGWALNAGPLLFGGRHTRPFLPRTKTTLAICDHPFRKHRLTSSPC